MPVHRDVNPPGDRDDRVATQVFTGGLALGVLLGVILALVFAQRRGVEARAAAFQAAREVCEKAAHLVTRGEAREDVSAFGEAAAIEREIGSPAG